MIRIKNSFFNSLTSIILSLINSIFGLVLLRIILKYVGSDYNGLNVTINQFVSSFLIFEGGMTLVLSYYLYKPAITNDFETINKYISFSKKFYYKLGFFILVIIIPSTIVYSTFIKSNVDLVVILFLFLIAITGLFVNVTLTLKYKLLLEVFNFEYKIHLTQIIISVFVQLISIVLLITFRSYIIIRLIFLLGQLGTYYILRFVVHKKFNKIDMDVDYDKIKIKGIGDVMTQKVTGVLYSSSFVLFSSVFIGTIFLSIYAVYQSIISIFKNIYYSIANGSRVQFAQLYASGSIEILKKRVILFEFAFVAVIITLSIPLSLVIVPFVNLFTSNVSDANYSNSFIAITSISIMFFEVVHIPAGQLLNSTGYFKFTKKLQIFVLITLIVLMVVIASFFENRYVLLSILISSIILSFSEILYLHIKVLSTKRLQLVRVYILNIFSSLVFYYFAKNFIVFSETYVTWFIQGVFVTVTFLIYYFICNLVYNRDLLLYWIKILMSFTKGLYIKLFNK